jgi:LEA14-like dessication related protein
MANNKIFGVGLTIAAVAAFAAYRMWNKKESIKFLQYQIAGLRFRAPNIFSPEITFSINVYNPNKTVIPVNSFFGTIKQSGTIVANFENTSPINLQGNTSQVIDIKANVKAISLVLAIIRNQINLKAVQIDGMIKTGYFDVHVNTTVNVLQALGGVADNTVEESRKSYMQRMAPFFNRKFINNRRLSAGFLNYGKKRNAVITGIYI